MLGHQGGAILFTASTSGVVGYRHYADYNASKGAVIALMRSMVHRGQGVAGIDSVDPHLRRQLERCCSG